MVFVQMKLQSVYYKYDYMKTVAMVLILNEKAWLLIFSTQHCHIVLKRLYFFSEMDKNTQIYSECHTDEDHLKIFGKIRTMDFNMGQYP